MRGKETSCSSCRSFGGYFLVGAVPFFVFVITHLLVLIISLNNLASTLLSLTRTPPFIFTKAIISSSPFNISNFTDKIV